MESSRKIYFQSKCYVRVSVSHCPLLDRISDDSLFIYQHVRSLHRVAAGSQALWRNSADTLPEAGWPEASPDAQGWMCETRESPSWGQLGTGEVSSSRPWHQAECAFCSHFPPKFRVSRQSLECECYFCLPRPSIFPRTSPSVTYKRMPGCMLSHLSCVQFFATLWTVTHQVPFSMGVSRQ